MAGVQGRVALVTGAGRGIGRSAIDLLAAGGATVVGISRSESELRLGGHDYLVADLSVEADCRRVVSETEAKFGTIDILVCNHGIGSAHERVVWEQDSALWEKTIRTNLDGPFFLSKQVLVGMTKRKYGRLVYTSSTAGLIAEAQGSAYNSSKHGLLGLMRSVAEDAGIHGITSNAVLPGWVRTEMAEKSAAREAEDKGVTVDDIWAERALLYPAKRVVTPEEVAHLIVFLASEEASGISGEAIRVALGSVW